MLHSAEDRQLHLFSVNGEHLASLGLRLWDAARGGRSTVRALLMTQGDGPGFIVVVEDGGLSVRRSHDLSLCCAARCTTGSSICCATMHPVGNERYEILAGLEKGKVVAWVFDLRDQLVGAGGEKELQLASTR